MATDFYPFVGSGDPAPDNSHLSTGDSANAAVEQGAPTTGALTTRIAIYDDMLSAPRVVMVEQREVRTYLEEVTNTVYRCMKEQGGRIALQVIRELVENLIHARFVEPIISVLDGGNTIRFADQGPGIADKERAFEFGVTSASREQKRYIRGTGSGFPIVSDYLENAGGAISIEDNIGQGTVVTVSVDAARVDEINRSVSRGAAVRGGHHAATEQGGGLTSAAGMTPQPAAPQQTAGMGGAPQPAQPTAMEGGYQQQAATWMPYPAAPQGYPAPMGYQPAPYGYPVQAGYPAPGYPLQAYGVPAAQPYAAPAAPSPAVPEMGGTAAQQQAAEPYVSDRGALALRFLHANRSGGPTDLAREHGASPATWSRELDALASTGLAIKRGQKYVLTELGQAWTQQHA